MEVFYAIPMATLCLLLVVGWSCMVYYRCKHRIYEDQTGHRAAARGNEMVYTIERGRNQLIEYSEAPAYCKKDSQLPSYDEAILNYQIYQSQLSAPNTQIVSAIVQVTPTISIVRRNSAMV